MGESDMNKNPIRDHWKDSSKTESIEVVVHKAEPKEPEVTEVVVHTESEPKKPKFIEVDVEIIE